MWRMMIFVGLVSSLPNVSGAAAILEVQADRLRFDPAHSERVSVSFALSDAAAVSLHIYDGMDRPVRTIGPVELDPGASKLQWDGKNDRGDAVPAEAYVYTLEAVGQDGERVIHDLTDATGSEPLAATDVRWLPEARRIEYGLDAAARVNVRIGLKNNGPLLATVQDWVPREPGRASAEWDGWDASHVLDLRAHPELELFVDAYTLSANTILVGPTSDKVVLPAEAGGKGAKRQRSTEPRKRMHYHAHQPLDRRGDVAISVRLADGAEDKPTVSGRVALRLDVDPQDRERILATRFEPVFFVDGTFAFENEVGFLPTTWIWDTTRVNNGVHYINVNVRGYEGNFGMATLKLTVDNADSKGSQ